MHAGGETRFFGLFLHAHVKFVAGVGLLAHDGIFGGSLVQLHAFVGRLLQALAHQLLAIERGLPVAAEALDQFGVLGLFLPVEILQLAANFDDAGKAGAVFGAELGLFLLQIAAAGVNLLQERGGKVAAFGLQARIGGDRPSPDRPEKRRDTRPRSECGRWWRPPAGG